MPDGVVFACILAYARALDVELVHKLVARHEVLITVEEGSSGGFGAAVMQALSDPCRVAIVQELLQARGRALACNEVRLEVSKATRSHHFEVLRAAGLIFT